MTRQRNEAGTARAGSRERLLAEAARLIAASPGQDVSLRAVCDAAGVKVPTLYHYFGSKEGLLDAVIEHGFELYVGLKQAHESTGDPLQDLRDGWDAHVAFGAANPGFYALMYGQVVPGRRPRGQQRPTTILRGLTRAAAQQGRLAVDPDQAADHVLAANIGVTLHFIAQAEVDEDLSAAVREATLQAITRGLAPARRTPSQEAADQLLDALGHDADGTPDLGEPELALLRKWLRQLSARS